MSEGGAKSINKRNRLWENLKLTGIFFIFGIGLFCFYAFEEFSWKLLKWQLLGLVLSLLCFLLLSVTRGNKKRVFVVFVLFVLMGTVPKLLLLRDPIEKAKVLEHQRSDPLKKLENESLEVTGCVWLIGNIDFSWICIMGAVVGLITFIRGKPTLIGKPKPGMSEIYYEKNIENIIFLLGKVIDGVFLIASGLVACMGVLWVVEKYRIASVASAKMLVACIFSVGGVFFWIVEPLYRRMSEILDIIKDSKNIQQPCQSPPTEGGSAKSAVKIK